MKKKVNISLISKQFDGENTEQTELMTEGELKLYGDGYELSYDESMASGFEGSVTSVRVKNKGLVTLKRRGEANMELVLELGKKHHCLYGTPYGDLMVGVSAKGISTDMTEEGGRLDLSYVIDVNSSYVGDFEINIGVKTIN